MAASTSLSFAGLAGAASLADGKVTAEEITAAAKQAISLGVEFAAAQADLGVTDEVTIKIAHRLLLRAISGKGGDVKKACRFAVKSAVALVAEINKLEPQATGTTIGTDIV